MSYELKSKELQTDLRRQIDALIETRQYVTEKILPILTEGQDFYMIREKKSLGKPGAEKLASIFGLTASFDVDKETMDLFKQAGLVAYVCNLTGTAGQAKGQGRGADTLARNQNDANKTIKMAQKRAFVDAVIRATGLSDIFTQDLEDMDSIQIEPNKRKSPTKSTTSMTAQQTHVKCATCDNETTAGKPQCYSCWSAGIPLTA